MNRKRLIIFHPFLFALYPVLLLFSENQDEACVRDVARAAGITLVVAIGTYALLGRLLRSSQKAGAIVSLSLLLFFIYGRVYVDYVFELRLRYVICQERVFVVVWCLLIALVVCGIIRTRSMLPNLTSFLNVAGVVLVAMPLASIVWHAALGRGHVSSEAKWLRHVDQWTAKTLASLPEPKEPLPDIYYIILDEYAREDILRNCFGYDNSEFVGRLERRGFYVAPCSRCNYMSTYWSIASSLNLDHVQTLMRDIETECADRRLIGTMIRYNRTSVLLKRIGYKFVFFPSTYEGTETNPNADMFMCRAGINWNEFDYALAESSMLRVINRVLSSQRRSHILYTFEHLRDVPRVKEPTFTFAHITIPHHPFIFDARGGFPKQERTSKTLPGAEAYRAGYLGQLEYATKRTEQVIDEILQRSEVPPVIIIQGDHGPGGEIPTIGRANPLKGEAYLGSRNVVELVPGRRYTIQQIRAPILNAYYLPGHRKSLYETITPANTFRVVLNEYFGANLPLIKDTTYKAWWSSKKVHQDSFKPVEK